MQYGLIGGALGHSFSKEIHEQIASYTYDLMPLTESAFHTFMEKRDFKAINVTIPYKKAVIPYLDEIEEAAEMIGAVNTIVNRNGKLIGYNTDYYGFAYMVKKYRVSMQNKKVLVIGNGGASLAIQAVVKKAQPKELVIVDVARSKDAVDYEEVYHKHLDAEIVINTSPVGMYPKNDAAPIDLRLFHCCVAVLDVVYNPITTKLCYTAKQFGLIHANGLEMLIAQAKYAVEHFLHQKIDDQIIETIYQKLLRDKINIVLIGMPSAGKTTIGRLLAKQMQKPFIDMDERIVAQAGKSIPQIFAEHGERGFRAYETQIAMQLAKQENSVIACGGGIVKYDVNMEMLGQNSIVIYLERDPANLSSNDPTRPLSSSKEAVEKMYRERLPLYLQYSDITVKNAEEPAVVAENCVQQIDAYIAKR